ncbi:acyl-CoA dehydrogenase family protein [Corynebacterium urogenitale]
MAASDVLARVVDIAADTAEALAAADEQQGSSQGSDGGHPSSHEAVLTTALAQLRKEKALDLVGWSRERGENHALLTALDVTRFLARADGSLAQIPQNHFVFSRYLAQSSVPGIEEKLIANAQVGAPHVGVRRKTVRGEQREVLSGSKRFCTGSTYAQVLAVVVEQGRCLQGNAPAHVVFIPSDAPGVCIHDDWEAIGQSFTGSGTVTFEDVDVTDAPRAVLEPEPGTREYLAHRGSFAQALHAAIDLGLFEGAVHSAWKLAAPAARGDDGPLALDPQVAQLWGEAEVSLFAARAAFEQIKHGFVAEGNAPGGELLDEDEQGLASTVTRAKLLIQEQALHTLPRLFEITGTAGCVRASDLDRRLRDLRVHSLHDRKREKLRILGEQVALGAAIPLDGKLSGR